MKNQKIVFTKVNTAEFLEQDLREIGNNEVLVEIAFSTISSGTEKANIIGDKNVNRDKNLISNFPRTSGYSSAGIVKKIGKDVKSVSVGDRVALSWSNHCKYWISSEENLQKITYDNISLRDAAFCHISTFPLAAIRKCRLEIGESAIVMGLGILGILAVMFLKTAGAYPVIAVDPVKERRELALKNGADFAFDPFDENFTENVLAVTNGVNVAIEVTGSGKALDQVLDCMAEFGRVALLGCTRNSDFTIDYYHKVHGPGISLIGAHTLARPKNESSNGMWTQKDDVSTTLKLLAGNRISFADLGVETHSPTEAGEVYNRLINDADFPIVQFDWRDI